MATRLRTAFDMPPALADAGYTVRAESDEDSAFLHALYASTRVHELAQLVDWSDAQRSAFLAQQFEAQRAHYRRAFAEAAFLLIAHRGTPVGRLYLEDRGATLHILDIALVPDRCGRGIGTALLEAVIRQANRAGQGVGIFVERFNPALRLYRRLGFVEVGDAGVYLELQHRFARGDPHDA